MIQYRLPRNIHKLISVYSILIFIFFIFRVILFFSQKSRVESSSVEDILQAFFIGWRFDTVISGYILAVPFLYWTIEGFFKKKCAYCRLFFRIWILLFSSLSFIICAIDIPYFIQFFSRLNSAALVWLDNGFFVMKMVLQEPRYFLIALPAIILIIFFLRVVNAFLKKTDKTENHIATKKKQLGYIFLSLLFSLLIFLGIRGRVELKSPIRIGTAYFSENAFLNQLGLNANFTLLNSFLLNKDWQYFSYFNDVKALEKVKNDLGIAANEEGIARNGLQQIQLPDNNISQKNIILILMESMSVGKMARGGNTYHLTPFLDSLSYEGLYFSNIYSAGTHTHNGIFSTLTSFPAQRTNHQLKEFPILEYCGFINTLHKKGYYTAYFTTHDSQFDNVSGFLYNNGIDTIIAENNYPSRYVHSTMGVSDDYLFEYSFPIINKINQKKEPFFAVYLTGSDHGPYFVPDYFKPTTTTITQQIVQYADWSLRKFINWAQQQPWYHETLFIFVADHGTPLDNTYEMALLYNHIPLLFFNPCLIEPQEKECFGTQMDIFPTAMHLLNEPFINRTLGIDLLQEKRPYSYFACDNKIGVIDKEWLLIQNEQGTEYLYQYTLKDKKNYAAQYPQIVTAMKEYALSNYQTAQILKQKNWQQCEP